MSLLCCSVAVLYIVYMQEVVRLCGVYMQDVVMGWGCYIVFICRML